VHAVPAKGGIWYARSLMRDPAGFLASCRDSGHDVVELRLGPRRALLLCQPGVVNRVLAEQADDYGKGGPFWDAMRPILGNGVGTCDGDEHKRMMPILTEGAFYQFVLPSFAQLLPTAHNRLYQRTRAEARDAVARLVKQARVMDESAQAGRCPAHQGLLASAISTGRQEELAPFTDEELADQVMTVLFAGIETSANVLSWALRLLAAQPEVADAVAEDAGGELVHQDS
jgi:cytochrome P450